MTLRISHTDKISSVLVFVLAAVVFYLTADFPSGFGATGPSLFPRAIVVLMSVFALVLLVKSVKREDVRTQEISWSAAKTVGIAAALVVGYLLLMPYLGFLAGTTAFLVVSIHFSGVSEFRKSIPVSIGVSIALFYIFAEFLRVPLPESTILPISRLLPTLLYGGVGIA